MQPKGIKREGGTRLFITWDDGHEGPVSMKQLRDSCPCAGCKGETVLFRTYAPPAPNVDAPGRYELKAAEQVGSYAIKFTWTDGHNLGIYHWEYLRSLCECDVCAKQRS